MADRGGVIRGRVHLADGMPVVEARVFLTSAPVDTPDVALLTDEEGRFSLAVPSPGRYVVACHADDLRPAQVEVDVSGVDSRSEVDIEMGPTR